MNHYLTISLLSVTFLVKGQNITFSSDLINSKDADIAEIKAVWLEYTRTCLLDLRNGNDSLSSKYWDITSDLGSNKDLLFYSINSKYPMYILGDLFTFNQKISIFEKLNMYKIG